MPFNPADPVNTPRCVNLANTSVRTNLMNRLGATAQFFDTNGIPLDRPWGRVHFDTRAGEVIPIHGGASYGQAVTFHRSGPDARAILTYSQSTNPESPHFSDMTRLYAEYGWVTMPYAEGDIRRDPNQKVFRLTERR